MWWTDCRIDQRGCVCLSYSCWMSLHSAKHMSEQCSDVQLHLSVQISWTNLVLLGQMVLVMSSLCVSVCVTCGSCTYCFCIYITVISHILYIELFTAHDLFLNGGRCSFKCAAVSALRALLEFDSHVSKM